MRFPHKFGVLAFALTAAFSDALADEPLVPAPGSRAASDEAEANAVRRSAPELSPAARAAQAAVSAEAASLAPEDGEAVLAFFAARDYRPFWTEPGSDRSAALLEALAAGGDHGLPVQRYNVAALGALRALADDPGESAAVEVAATRSFLAYARDLAGGVVDPRAVDSEINLDPERPAPGDLLARLAAPRPMSQILAALAPQDREYDALLAEKSRLEGLLLAGGWGETVQGGPTLRIGDADPRVGTLRNRLARLGQGALGSSPIFDAGLEAAVEQFQNEHGLLDDGAVGPRTLAAINASVDDRLAQVLVNLERIRWRDDDLGARYVYVNIPDYSVRMVEGGAPVFQSRVVVGQAADTRTPEFSEEMTHMVVNPTWYIPNSIAKRVYLPKLKANRNVLANNNMRLFTRSGTEINPTLVDWRQVSSGNFPFRVRQNPSASNALGRVKFMFPNQFAIYLHDTPAKELFDRDAPAFSNGCVRVEQPFEFAHRLLAPQLDDPEGTFAAWVAARSERYVNLDQPIPVHIVYRTAVVDPDGSVRYRDDIYGRDAKVFRALSDAGVTSPAVQG